MFARAKIKLATIPGELLRAAPGADIAPVCELHATNAKGEPASGTIKAPDVRRHTR